MSLLNPEHCAYHERSHAGECDECAEGLRRAKETLVAAASVGDWRRSYEVWRSFPELHDWWARYCGVAEGNPDVLQSGSRQSALPDPLPPGWEE